MFYCFLLIQFQYCWRPDHLLEGLRSDKSEAQCYFRQHFFLLYGDLSLNF